jgi:hypothetical protein
MRALSSRIRRLEHQAQPAAGAGRDPHAALLVRELARQILMCLPGSEHISAADTDATTWRSIQRLRAEAVGKFGPSPSRLMTIDQLRAELEAAMAPLA